MHRWTQQRYRNERSTVPTRRRMPMIAIAVTLIVASTGTAVAQDQLTLDGFLARVESHSLQLDNSRTDRDIALTQERLARSQVYPTVAGQAGYTRNFLDIEQAVPAYVNTGGSPAIPGTQIYPIQTQEVDVNTDNQFSAGLSVQQKVFDMSVFRALEASQQYTSLTGTAYEASRQAILTQAKRLFFQALLLQEVLDVRQSSEEIAYDNYVETQRRLDNGLASPLEVLQAEVNWKITQPDTTQAERNLNVALQNLRTFAGIDSDTEIELVGSLDQYPALPSFENAFSESLERPDYQALVAQRRLRELNVDAERAKFYPSLSASITYGWQAGDNGFDLSGGTDTLSAGLQLTVPVFFGGSRFASLDQAQLELQKTNTQIALQQDTIATQLETLRLTLEEANQRIATAEQTLATAERAYQVSQTSFDNGLATQLELKDARVSQERAQLNYVSAVFDYLSAYFDWQLATGRGDQGI